MDITTPSEPPKQRERHVVVDVTTKKAPVEEFTIAIVGLDDKGTLAMEWGSFRWTTPIVVAR